MFEIIRYEVINTVNKPFSKIIMLVFILASISLYMTEVDPLGWNLNVVNEIGEVLDGRDAVAYNKV